MFINKYDFFYRFYYFQILKKKNVLNCLSIRIRNKCKIIFTQRRFYLKRLYTDRLSFRPLRLNFRRLNDLGGDSWDRYFVESEASPATFSCEKRREATRRTGVM